MEADGQVVIPWRQNATVITGPAVAFEEEKVLGRPAGRAPLFGNAEVSGYEIRHGRVHRRGGGVFVEGHWR